MRTFNSNPIVNIVRTELVTDEAQPRVLHFETVSSAVPEPFISEGEETELRIRNTILAQERLEDIIKGYNITLKDCVMSRELLEAIDGGVSASGVSGMGGYRTPAAGTENARVHFTLNLYAAEKDYAGEAVSYFRFSFPDCVGSPAKLSFENGSFTAPEYTVRSRPAAGDSAMKIGVLDALPEYCAAADELPETPAAGYCFIATDDMTVGTLELETGALVYYNGTAYVRGDE